MHTLIRDREISKHDFVFYSDRLIRLVIIHSLNPKNYPTIAVPIYGVLIMLLQVVEHGLGHLPFTEKQITTPTGMLEVVCILCLCAYFPFYFDYVGVLPLLLFSCSSMSRMLTSLVFFIICRVRVHWC